jgi:hydrogenase assembly chaperone HypC/HupF
MNEINYCSPDKAGHCITCSDEALPAQVRQVDLATQIALVAVGEATAEVDISLVDTPAPGEWLLVHGGVALSRLEKAEA